MDLFDFNHDGEVSDLERIMGLAAVLSETNPNVEISVTVGEDDDYESMTHEELEECLDELRAQRDSLECDEPDDLDNGVLMEGYSVEDKGAGVSYCVFAYNVQPGIEIDYATGESKLADGAQQEEQKTATVTPTPSPEPEKQEPVTGSEASQADYILNTNTKKFHYPTCSSVNDMKEKNKQEFFGTRDETIALGYSPCGRCKP